MTDYLAKSYDDALREIERLRAGLQLIAGDKNRLMNEVARQTAAQILGGKPIGEVAEWPTREEAEKRAAELMRLAEVERLLLVARDCLRTAHNGWAETLGREIDAFCIAHRPY
jgi:hypothetical protein